MQPEVKPVAGSRTSEERNLEGFLSSEVFSVDSQGVGCPSGTGRPSPLVCRISTGLPQKQSPHSRRMPAPTGPRLHPATCPL